MTSGVTWARIWNTFGDRVLALPRVPVQDPGTCRGSIAWAGSLEGGPAQALTD